MMKKGKRSKILDKKTLTNAIIIEAAKHGDKLSLAVLRELASLIGRKFASLVNLLNPELIVIGGDIVGVGNLFLKPLTTSIRSWAFDMQLGAVDVRLSKLRDPYAGALSATVLVI